LFQFDENKWSTLYGKKFMTFIGKADDVSWIKTNASAKRFNLEKPKEKT